MFSPGIEQLDEIIGKCEETLRSFATMVCHPRCKSTSSANLPSPRLRPWSADPVPPLPPGKGSRPTRNPDEARQLGSGPWLHWIRSTNCATSSAPPLAARTASHARCSMQSFKGGVAKSVSTVYFAQYLAIRGYRVLVVDCDPQASATSSFGYIPDHAFTEADTMIPISTARRTPSITRSKDLLPGIDLVPSCLPWYEVEFGLFNAVTHADTEEERLSYYQELRQAIRTVEVNYDVVLMDSPPALGMISINILSAADGVIVPTRPACMTSPRLPSISRWSNGSFSL